MLPENFKNISLETQVSFMTSRNNLKTFSGLVINYLATVFNMAFFNFLYVAIFRA